MSDPAGWADAVRDAFRKLNSDYVLTGTPADVQTLMLATREQAFRFLGLVPTHRHVKSSGLYSEEGRCHLQTDTPVCDNARLVVYRGQDGRMWARPNAEFDDPNRFQRLHVDDIADHIIDSVECGCGLLHTKTVAGWAVTRPVSEAETAAIDEALDIHRINPSAAWPFPTSKDRA